MSFWWKLAKTNVRWYEEEFEQQLLAACRVYYREEKERLRSGELYKQKCEELFSKEQERLKTYVSSASTAQRVLELLVKEVHLA